MGPARRSRRGRDALCDAICAAPAPRVRPGQRVRRACGASAAPRGPAASAHAAARRRGVQRCSASASCGSAGAGLRNASVEETETETVEETVTENML